MGSQGLTSMKSVDQSVDQLAGQPSVLDVRTVINHGVSSKELRMCCTKYVLFMKLKFIRKRKIVIAFLTLSGNKKIQNMGFMLIVANLQSEISSHFTLQIIHGISLNVERLSVLYPPEVVRKGTHYRQMCL